MQVTYVILELIRTCSPPVVRRNSTKTNSKTGTFVSIRYSFYARKLQSNFEVPTESKLEQSVPACCCISRFSVDLDSAENVQTNVEKSVIPFKRR